MNIVVFILLMIICIGSVYIVHKYFGKSEFYLLAVIYSIMSFLMSFKMINIFGININCSIIFESGILTILYYFINRYSANEVKKYFITIVVSTVVCELFLITTSFIVPSIYDKMSTFYEDLITTSTAIFVFYPISLIISLVLSGYAFKEIKSIKENKLVKMILILIGIMFIDTLLFIYFSYAFIIRFDTSLIITLDNYIIRVLVMVTFILITSRLLRVKKVKE